MQGGFIIQGGNRSVTDVGIILCLLKDYGAGYDAVGRIPSKIVDIQMDWMSLNIRILFYRPRTILQPDEAHDLYLHALSAFLSHYILEEQMVWLLNKSSLSMSRFEWRRYSYFMLCFFTVNTICLTSNYLKI